MQATMDDCGRSYATQSHIKALWWHLDNFAFELDIIDKMYSQIISVSTEQGETKRTPFTEKEVEALWKISDQKNVDIVLIYIYTGFRLMELKKNILKAEANLLQGRIELCQSILVSCRL